MNLILQSQEVRYGRPRAPLKFYVSVNFKLMYLQT